MARLTPWTALLAALLSVAAAGCGADKNGQACPSGQTFCGTCRDPASFQTDPDNCGACGIACGHGTCAGGVCQCDGWTFCAGQNPRCADTQNDPANCNGCGLACTKPGAGCAGGICGCYAPRPDDCETLCTNVRGDARNCGTNVSACGHDCPLTNDVCVDGACTCPVSLPTACGNTCVNTQTNPAHCSACDAACTLPGKTQCAGGNCVCVAGLTDCGASGCFDFQTDEGHCGGCGTICPATATCTTGTCRCPAGPQAGCGAACCAGGTACCGASCQTQHANGLGQYYFDCGSLDQHTLEQAGLAAIAWSASGSTWEAGLACGSCLCRQSATQAAVWCYAGSPMKGLVQVTRSPNCLAAACPISGSAQAWH
jgi:hypothetical protein